MEVTLKGDEHAHYYQDAEGNCYAYVDDDCYEMMSNDVRENMQKRALQRKAERDNFTQRRVGETKDKAIFRGKRKGLIVLANFTDKKFVTSNPQEVFNRIANEHGYSEGDFRGSVSDYFYDNSFGKFELDFDVIGPIELAHNMAYYGKDQGSTGDDIRPAEMIKEALESVADQVNFNDYDWDGDGEVDQVFVIYAGYNQAQGGPSNTIWPHMWTLEAGLGSSIELNGVTLNTYACSSELSGGYGNNIDGIGTICHEFSHCMGFPDLYDVAGGNCFGMGDWSLMCSGNYNGDSFCPAAYTSYERMVCGWLTPIELTEPVSIKGMKGLTEGGESYIIYSDNSRRTEYYLLENRQPVSWDEALPGNGLLILHVDYKKEAWTNNLVNTTSYSYYNKHERCTIFHADNNTGGYYSNESDAGDPYPYGNNNSWTSTSTPAAIQYNGGDTKKKLEDREVTDITRNSDGTIDFRFRLADDDATVYRTLYLDELTSTPQQCEEGVYNVHTNRLLASNQWETLWLPFSMTDQQVQQYFGKRAKIATLSNVDPEEGVLYFETSTNGIAANTPMLIKMITGDELNDVGNIMQMELTADNLPVVTTVGDYSFVGSRVVETLSENNFYLNTDYFANAVEKDETSASEENEATDTTPTADAKQVKALQAFVANAGADRPAMKIAIDGEILNDEVNTKYGTDPTGIRAVAEANENGKVYNLQGIEVDKNRMVKGIYIVDGKKVVVE